MIICKSRGFIFLRIPKTASSSLSLHLERNISFTDEDMCFESHTSPPKNIKYPECTEQHANLKFAIDWNILSESDIQNMRVYGVMREPIERILSMFNNVVGVFLRRNNLQIKKFTTNQIAEIAITNMLKSSDRFKFTLTNRKYFPLYPQSHWLIHNQKPISDIIIYPKFNNFLKEVSGNDHHLEWLVASPQTIKVELRDDLRQEIVKLYKEDFELWEQLNSPVS